MWSYKPCLSTRSLDCLSVSLTISTAGATSTLNFIPSEAGSSWTGFSTFGAAAIDAGTDKGIGVGIGERSKASSSFTTGTAGFFSVSIFSETLKSTFSFFIYPFFVFIIKYYHLQK